jgi:hypothetical protein
MTSIKGVIQNGQVILPRPAELPDGTVVRILPVNAAEADDEDRPLGPEEIARVLALMDQVQPFEMTEEERAAWEARRQARKDWEKAGFNEHADKLRGMWK